MELELQLAAHHGPELAGEVPPGSHLGFWKMAIWVMLAY